MIDLPAEAVGALVAIEFTGVDECFVDQLKPLFTGPGEEVIFSHAFGGQDALIVVAVFGQKMLDKLISIWPKMKAQPARRP
jgi:hypothetical protein